MKTEKRSKSSNIEDRRLKKTTSSPWNGIVIMNYLNPKTKQWISAKYNRSGR